MGWPDCEEVRSRWFVKTGLLGCGEYGSCPVEVRRGFSFVSELREVVTRNS